MPRTKKHKLAAALAVLLTSASSFAVLAETTPDNGKSIAPQRGENMPSVLNRLGEPKEKIAPVGQPPIGRWVYQDFTVYFEGSYVIHSVANEIRPKTTK